MRIMQERKDNRSKGYFNNKKGFGCNNQVATGKKPGTISIEKRDPLENKKVNHEWVKIKFECHTYWPTTITNSNSNNNSQKQGHENSRGSRRSSTTITISSSSGITYCSCMDSRNSIAISHDSLPVSSKCKYLELNKPKYTNQRSYYENLRKQSEQHHVDLGVAGALDVNEISNNKQVNLCTMNTVTVAQPTTEIYNRAYVRSIQEFRLRNRKECFFE